MKWTKGLPPHKGWWWFRKNKIGDPHILYYHGEGLVHGVEYFGGVKIKISNRGWFAGPIPEPEEA